MTFSEKFQGLELYPAGKDPCHCGSLKQYKKCCYQEENKPFTSLEEGLTIIPDDHLFVSENAEENKKLRQCLENLHEGKALTALNTLQELNEKRPNNSEILFLIALGYRLNQNFEEAQKLLRSTKSSHFLPLKLLRWLYAFEWDPHHGSFPLKSLNTLRKIAPHKNNFYLTEFCLWGLICILDALNGNRFIEAEAYFISLAKMAANKGTPHHWAIEEGTDILESAYFLRRLTLNDGEDFGKK